MLQDQGLDAKLLSGGQSLIPMLAFRLTSCTSLIDLKHVPELDKISIGAQGIKIGSRVRWRDIERDARLSVAHPLLSQTIPHIAHYAIRNRGTVGGSLAHADPAAEFPALAVTCDASIEIGSAVGRRIVPASRFFLAPLTTVLEPEEMIISIHFPSWPCTRKSGFQEFCRRKGDFAIAGAIVYFDQGDDGKITSARVGAFGVAGTPILLSKAADFLLGKELTTDICEQAADLGVRDLDVCGDLQSNADYRRALLRTMIKRALLDTCRLAVQ